LARKRRNVTKEREVKVMGFCNGFRLLDGWIAGYTELCVNVLTKTGKALCGRKWKK
jgi:hypothetical protein